MNVQQDQIEEQEKERSTLGILLGIVHGDPQRTARILSNQKPEEPIDPDFESEMNSDLWLANLDLSKGVQFFDE